MIRIDTANLIPGDLLCGRNTTIEGKGIRAGVHSTFNHNATVVLDPQGRIAIGEAKPPESAIASIDEYERIINDEGYRVRFYRHKTLTEAQRLGAAEYFTRHLLGLPYPRKRRMILLALPLYNAFVDKTGILPPMRLTWCSQLCKEAYLSQDPHCLDGIDGEKKELFTPRTFEKRILWGRFFDITDQAVIQA